MDTNCPDNQYIYIGIQTKLIKDQFVCLHFSSRVHQEMEVWKSVSYFTFMVFFGTFFSCLDLPINVPILVAYFIFIMFFVFKVKI